MAVVACGLVVATIVAFHGLRHDDAYISFRYGQNLSRGRGLVFNVGGRTMGSTSPAATLVSAGVHVLFGDAWLPSVMSAIGCVAWVGTALAVYVLLRRRGGRGVAAFTALAVGCGVTGAAAWVALETHWAVALALWALWCVSRERVWSAAVLAALAGWARPDALLVTLPIVAWAFAKERWRAVGPAVLSVALVAPWYAFCWCYYGEPLPQSLHAKFGAVGFVEYGTHVVNFVPSVVMPWVPAAVAWAFGVGGWLELMRRVPEMALVAGYGALELGAYLVLRPGTAFIWHLQPVVAVFSVGLVGGAVSVVTRLRMRVWRGLGAVCGLVFVGTVARDTMVFASEYREALWFGQRHLVYEDLSAFLVGASAADDGVSWQEVGTIAYLTDLPMNDRMGLVTRHPDESLRRFLAGEPTKLRWLVLRKNELEPARPIYGRRPARVFRRGEYRVFVFDLHARDEGQGT